MINTKKIEETTLSHEEYMNRVLQDEEYQKEFLNITMEEYLEDGDFKEFFRSLEQVIRARGSIKSFAEKTKIDRANLYAMFKGENVPRLDTLARILKELGFSLKVA